ncbi:hypothetical protein NWFMUON74_44470 [Nocardia wallacei]|uniref:Uncharacterized protein n=1 Tax=Nocardia wallacei TaxID=480035 RepID=A0A7G1KN40_9NOCA|nr:hypothetical protein NWFMUON74_44470 [Nocardia wallacei]
MTPRTFRRGAGTAIDHAHEDAGRAGRQLGNTKDIARIHYIDAPEVVPDNRDVLERWARGDRPPKV